MDRPHTLMTMPKVSCLHRIAALTVAAASLLLGDELQVRSEASSDDLGIRSGALDVQWSHGSGPGIVRLGATGAGWSGPELSGVLASERLDLGLGIGVSRTLGNLDIALDGHLVAVDRLESWGLLGSATWNFAPGWSVEIAPRSQELAGWLSQGVRVQSLATVLDWSGSLAWAGAGARWEDRSGGDVPAGSMAIDLPENQILTTWAWGARTVVEGVVLGLSGTWADASDWTRQATGTRNDSLQWLDVPYRSPHEEISLDAVVKLRRWNGRLESTWPVWSSAEFRVESPWIAQSPWTYRLDHVGIGEVELGWDIPLAGTVLGLEAFARSRPYAPAAWFTDRAWNQFGLLVSTTWSIPTKENLP